ncbi:MAG TPA: P-loop NTPase fold protein [Solirubrobacteraceae bacterium]|jgi:hypothetical protein|nr:P-loop NTPase fold protein [Solirubrobacteraceae bacterium]
MLEASNVVLRPDEPIQSLEEDFLARGRFAEAVALQVRTAPTAGGFVVGVLGPWGEGKTSVLNMVFALLERDAPETIRVQFDPWLFSSSEQLLERYFAELATTLGEHAGLTDRLVTTLRSALVNYGALLGSVGELAAEQAQTSIYQQRRSITTQLRSLGRRIVVRIDDLDRLTPEEIREVVRLVKLVGDFPNIVYLLAFDRTRVERVLGEQLAPGDAAAARTEGRAYLEKIVQVVDELPPVPQVRLVSLLDDELGVLLSRVARTIEDPNRWREVLSSTAPLLRNLRDTRRLLNAMPLQLELLGDEVDLADLLALTVLRVFLPDVHSRLGESAVMLTGGAASDSDQREQELRRLSARAGEQSPAAEALLRVLFVAPAASPPGGELEADVEGHIRVYVTHNLLRYLHGEGSVDPLANAQVRWVVDAMAEPRRLRDILNDLPAEILPDLATRALGFRRLFPPGRGGHAAAAWISRLESDGPETRSTYDGLEPFSRLLSGLLSLGDERQRHVAAQRAWNAAHTLTGRVLVLESGAFPASKVTELRSRLRRELAEWPVDQLARELDLPWVVSNVSDGDVPDRVFDAAAMCADETALSRLQEVVRADEVTLAPSGVEVDRPI